MPLHILILQHDDHVQAYAVWLFRQYHMGALEY